jgi:hypothetical protein
MVPAAMYRAAPCFGNIPENSLELRENSVFIPSLEGFPWLPGGNFDLQL